MGDKIRAFLQIDWAFLKEAWSRDGIFWFREFLLVAAALYVASHVIKRRPFLSKMFCRVLGHLWVVQERDQNRWHARRASLGIIAGSRCECRRCHATVSDLPQRTTQAEETEDATEETPEADAIMEAMTDVQRQARQMVDDVFGPRPTPAAPGVTVTTRVVRTTTTSRSNATPKKKAAAAAKPKKQRGGKRPTRFDRDVFGDEDPTASASPRANGEPQKPADTSSPSAPSEPEGSEPS